MKALVIALHLLLCRPLVVASPSPHSRLVVTSLLPRLTVASRHKVEADPSIGASTHVNVDMPMSIFLSICVAEVVENQGE